MDCTDTSTVATFCNSLAWVVRGHGELSNGLFLTHEQNKRRYGRSDDIADVVITRAVSAALHTPQLGGTLSQGAQDSVPSLLSHPDKISIPQIEI